MLALIDGDVVVYRVGYTTMEEDLALAKWRCNDLIRRICNDTESDDFQIYLSDVGENNFRRHIYPAYKMNRTQPKPVHYEALKEYLVTDFKAIMTPEQEADDMLGIDCTKEAAEGRQSVICTNDKDLNQIPGLHYNFVKADLFSVDPQTALRFFYMQLLQGDKVDNIPGIYGVGPVNAGKILGDAKEEDDMFKACLEAYKQNDMSELDLYLTGLLIKIRTQPEELWNFPKTFQSLQPEMEALLSYSQTKAEGNMVRVNTPL